MAKKKPRRDEINEKIRDLRKKIEENRDLIASSEKLIADITAMLDNGFTSNRKDYRIDILQANRLRAVRRKRFAVKSINKSLVLIAELEQILIGLSVSEDSGPQESKDGKETEWYLDSDGRRRKKEIEPGWRWVKGYENRYAWSTTGFVGVLKKSEFASYWVMNVIKAMGGKRHGAFNLNVAGVTERKAFSTITEESKDNPVIARFTEGSRGDAQMVGIEGEDGRVICRFRN